MPRLKTVLTAEIMAERRKVRTPQADILMVQMDHLHDIISQKGLGGDVVLDEGEDSRTQKRRYTIAAKQLGKVLKWRTAPAGELSFVLSDPQETREHDPDASKRGRPKKGAS